MPEAKEAQAKKEDVMQSVGAASGIPDVSQTITQNQATRSGFSPDRAMAQVMDVWKSYLASQNFTQEMAPPPSVQSIATSYGASKEMMGVAPPVPSSSITQSAAIPAGPAIEAPKIGVDSGGYAISPEGQAAKQQAGQPIWSQEMLSKYPELANVTDPNIIAQLQNLPDITLKDVKYGPGWTDIKGRYTPDQQFGPQAKRQLEASGMMKDGRMVIPTNQEELNRWAYMREVLSGMKTGGVVDRGWTSRIDGVPIVNNEGGQDFDRSTFSGYTPWSQPHFLSAGKFDPAKYASVSATDTSYNKWLEQNVKASPATTGAIPAPSNDTGGWA